jgi:hypothetical protein
MPEKKPARPGGGRTAISRHESSDKSRAHHDTTVVQPQPAPVPAVKAAKLTGGGRRAFVAPQTRTPAERLRAAEAAEAALAGKKMIRHSGGGRRAVPLSDEARRARLKALEEKFPPGGGRHPPRRPRSTSSASRSSQLSAASLVDYHASTSSVASESRQSLEFSPSQHAFYDSTRRARSKRSEHSLTSYAPFVPPNLPPPPPSVPSPHKTGHYVVHVPQPPQHTISASTPNREAAIHARRVHSDDISVNDHDHDDHDGHIRAHDPHDSGEFQHRDEEPDQPSAPQFPVTVSVTTSSTTARNPISELPLALTRTVERLIGPMYEDPMEYKKDPNALFPRKRWAPLSDEEAVDRTAFANYNLTSALVRASSDDDDDDGWESGELRRREIKQGWIGEWIIQGKVAADMQEVIRMLRAL